MFTDFGKESCKNKSIFPFDTTRMIKKVITIRRAIPMNQPVLIPRLTTLVTTQKIRGIAAALTSCLKNDSGVFYFSLV